MAHKTPSPALVTRRPVLLPDKPLEWIGHVRELRQGLGLPLHGEIPGRVPRAVLTDSGIPLVAYFHPDRLPELGSRIAVRGAIVVLELERDPTNPLHAQRLIPVDYQLKVLEWTPTDRGRGPRTAGRTSKRRRSGDRRGPRRQGIPFREFFAGGPPASWILKALAEASASIQSE